MIRFTFHVSYCKTLDSCRRRACLSVHLPVRSVHRVCIPLYLRNAPLKRLAWVAGYASARVWQQIITPSHSGFLRDGVFPFQKQATGVGEITSMSAFIESIILARKEAADDASSLAECATQLQQHNRDLKQYIAKLDAEAIKEATAGFGTNDRKLIVSLCSRTKSQLARRAREPSTRHRTRAHYHACTSTSHDPRTPVRPAQDGGQVPRAVRRGPSRGGPERDERQLRQAREPRPRPQGRFLRGHHRPGVRRLGLQREDADRALPHEHKRGDRRRPRHRQLQVTATSTPLPPTPQPK